MKLTRTVLLGRVDIQIDDEDVTIHTHRYGLRDIRCFFRAALGHVFRWIGR